MIIKCIKTLKKKVLSINSGRQMEPMVKKKYLYSTYKNLRLLRKASIIEKDEQKTIVQVLKGANLVVENAETIILRKAIN